MTEIAEGARTDPPPLDGHAPVLGVLRHVRRVGLHRRLLVGSILTVLVLAGFCATVAFGSLVVPLDHLLPALFDRGERRFAVVVHTLRLPREGGAVLVGAALAVSGSIFQTVTRNPLASPDILGITPAAAAGAAAAILVWHGDGAAVAAAALAGALVAAGATYGLSWRGGVDSYRFVLIGIGIAAMAGAVTSWLLAKFDALQASSALIWITGSLTSVRPGQLPLLLGALLVALAVLTAIGPRLEVLELGDDTATALGVRTERTRALALGLAVLLAAAGVAAAGPIPFVALVSAPIARRMTGSPGLVPWCAALVGAALTLGADQFALRLLDNQPVGVATGVLGAPYLIWLLTRRSTSARG